MHPITKTDRESSPGLVSPVLGLPVRQKNEWTDVRLSRDFRITLSLVGDRIVVFRPVGKGGLHEVAAGLKLVSEAVEEITNKGLDYVLVSDVADSRGMTREARGYYTENMRNRRRLLGLVFFGASPMLKLSIRIGKRFNYPGMDVRIVDNYADALTLARQMLSNHEGGVEAAAGGPPLPPGLPSAHLPGLPSAHLPGLPSAHLPALPPGGGPGVLARDAWRLSMDGFSVQYEIIDQTILHARCAGYFGVKHIEPMTALREEVRREARPDGSFDYMVSSLDGLKGADRKARTAYMNSLEKWCKTRPFRMVVFHGFGGFMKTAIMLARPFAPFKVRLAENLDDALALVQEDRKKTGGSPPAPVVEEAGAEPGDRIRGFIDDLLRYIGSIDWEKDGIEPNEHVDISHPFNPVFEAIALIKEELDEHFRERERAEKALRESEVRFQEVLKHSRDILFKRNIRTGDYAYISQAVAPLLGYTAKEISDIGFTGVKGLMHPEDVSKYEAFIEALVKTESDDDIGHLIEYRLRSRDGRYRWFSDSHALVRDPDGRPRFIIGNNRDITDQKKAEIELKEHHERFLTVLDSIDAHVYVVDMETYEILLMNKRMKVDYGGDMVGRICWKSFHDNDGPCAHCTNHRLLDDRGRPTGVYIWEGTNPITGRWYINHDRAIKWVDGRYVRLEIAADITRLKRLEEERRKAEEQRRHSRKLEAVGTMAEGIAHNFNNYLMAVMGNLDLTLADLPPGSSFEINIREALDATRKAAELSTLMLTYVGQGKVRMKVIDMTEAAREIVESPSTSILKKTRLKLDFSSEPTLFKGDADQVRQVIVNLLTNAVEASEENGGEIALSTGVVHHDRAWFGRQIMKEELPGGEYIYFEAADAGTGMDEETVEKVLDPFFTTKFTGRGLGMAAVGGIMRSHSGAISLESDPGGGTVVRVLFPALKEKVRKAPRPTPAPPRKDGSILLVDDEEIARTVGKAMLEKMGFRVLTAVDGLDAVETFRTRAAEIRCVVLDVTMPRMDGVKAFRELRRIDPDVRVLVSSGYTEGGVADRFENDAPAGFIHKPFNMKEFLKKIEEVME